MGRFLRRRCYTLTSGLLLATLAGALVFTLVPMTYSSSGTVAVMPPTRPAGSSAGNPLLALDYTVHNAASILTQSMNGPLLQFRAGVTTGPTGDEVTTRNAAIGAYDGGSLSPFVTVTAVSRHALRSPALVGWLIDAGRENLTQRQHELRVAGRNLMTLETVVEPTPPRTLWLPTVSATAAALLLGLVATALGAIGLDRIEGRRRGGGLAPVVPLRGAHGPPTRPTGPDAAPVRPVAVLAGRREAG